MAVALGENATEDRLGKVVVGYLLSVWEPSLAIPGPIVEPFTDVCYDFVSRAVREMNPVFEVRRVLAEFKIVGGSEVDNLVSQRFVPQNQAGISGELPTPGFKQALGERRNDKDDGDARRMNFCNQSAVRVESNRIDRKLSR